MFTLSVLIPNYGWHTDSKLFATREQANTAGIKSGYVFSVGTWREVGCQCWEGATMCRQCADNVE